jgi:hypothetical protein
MIKFGLKPAMTMSLDDSDNPVEQLNTIIDFAKEREVPKLMQRLDTEKQYRELPADDGYDETQDLKTFIRSRFIVGDPSGSIEQIQTHRKRLSLNHFIFRIASSEGNRHVMIEKIKLMGREVIGHFEKEV